MCKHPLLLREAFLGAFAWDALGRGQGLGSYLSSGQTTSCLAPSTQTLSAGAALVSLAEVCEARPGAGLAEGRRWAVGKARKAKASAVTDLQVRGRGPWIRVTTVLLPACVPAVGPWLSMVPAHVERIRARKDMFSPPSFLEGGSRGPGDSPEIRSVWTAPLPFLSISQAAWRCTPSVGSPGPQVPSQPRKGAPGRIFWSIPGAPSQGAKGSPGLGASLGIRQDCCWA